jgi:DNA-binding response OmpR family regulator
VKILLVEDEPSVLDVMKRVMEKHSHEVVTAPDGIHALQIFDTAQPDLLITDIQMPTMDGLTLLSEVREKNRDVIVVVMTGDESANTAVEALRRGANNYLWKPINITDLLSLLHRYESIVNERVIGREIQKSIVFRTLTLSLENHLNFSTEYARFLVEETKELLPEKERRDITLGLDELLMNAMEHGNLGITYEEKNASLADIGGLRTLYEKRLADPVRAARRVCVEFQFNGTFFEWVISDEGEGFDWSAIPNPLEENRILNSCGRGIFLSRLIFDEMEYLGKGNVVRVRKYLKKPGDVGENAANPES